MSVAGENGEYHTLVVGGPGFRPFASGLLQALAAAGTVIEGGYGFVDLASAFPWAVALCFRQHSLF